MSTLEHELVDRSLTQKPAATTTPHSTHMETGTNTPLPASTVPVTQGGRQSYGRLVTTICEVGLRDSN